MKGEIIMAGKVDILGVPVDALTMDEAVDAVVSCAAQEGVHAVYTPNAEIMMQAYRDPELKRILLEAFMLTADGAGVVLAAKLLGTPLPAKVSGVDISRRLFAAAPAAGLRFFLFGGKPGVAEKAREKLRQEFPALDIAGTHHGYFSPAEEPGIVDAINASGANVLLVALGAPKQEKWIHSHRDVLKPRICMGVGGSIDIFAGEVPMAPEFLRNHGLEWLYRLCREPRRFKRMLDLPRFMLRVLRARRSL